MTRTETPEQVKLWFQAAVRDLWPVAIGSVSLRKSPCIRTLPALRNRVKGITGCALYGRSGKRRFSMYVPDELPRDVEKAIQNGRDLRNLVEGLSRFFVRAGADEATAHAKRKVADPSAQPRGSTRCSTKPTFSSGVQRLAFNRKGAGRRGCGTVPQSYTPGRRRAQHCFGAICQPEDEHDHPV